MSTSNLSGNISGNQAVVGNARDVVLKLMNSILNAMEFRLKMTDFVLEMMHVRLKTIKLC